MKSTVNLIHWNNEKIIKVESVNKDLNKAGGSPFYKWSYFRHTFETTKLEIEHYPTGQARKEITAMLLAS